VTTSLVHAVSGGRSAQIGSSQEVGAVPHEQSPGAEQVVLACPGRIEGATETVKVGAGISGVLQMVPVEEGQWVNAGDVLARFDCADLEAESQVAESALEVAQQSRRRLLRGSREEERKEANATVVKGEAIGRQAGAAYDRTMHLFNRKVASQDDLDRARRDNEVSKASLRRAREHAQLIDAPPLPEEVAKADAEVELAQNRLLETRHRFDKCTIRAPISGVVLRRYLQAGESVSVTFPHVIVAVADTSKYRARGEVDERDVGRVALGQTVVVSADALSGAITGRVSSIGHAMGRKSVYSGEPSEKKDQDILEVVVDLDHTTQRLLVGLRVTLRFVRSAEHAGQSEQPFVLQ
jgi:multidrug resistance efflux pump